MCTQKRKISCRIIIKMANVCFYSEQNPTNLCNYEGNLHFLDVLNSKMTFNYVLCFTITLIMRLNQPSFVKLFAVFSETPSAHQSANFLGSFLAHIWFGALARDSSPRVCEEACRRSCDAMALCLLALHVCNPKKKGIPSFGVCFVLHLEWGQIWREGILCFDPTSSLHHLIPPSSHSSTASSLHHLIPPPPHPSTISSLHHLIPPPSHPSTASSLHLIPPSHPSTASSLHHLIPPPPHPSTISSLHRLIPPPSHPSTISSLHRLIPPLPHRSISSLHLIPPPPHPSTISSLHHLIPPPPHPSTASSLHLIPPSHPSTASSLHPLIPPSISSLHHLIPPPPHPSTTAILL